MKYSQGPDYEEFVKAAISDNGIQFIEVSDTDVAKVLFPAIKDTNNFIGIVKSEPERYTPYGECVIWLQYIYYYCLISCFLMYPNTWYFSMLGFLHVS